MSELALDVATFASRADPASLANAGKYYSKDVSGTVHWFYEDNAGTVYQITPVVGATGIVAFSELSNLLVLGSENTLADSGAVQSIFASANDSVTLVASTKYLMRMHLVLLRTGTNSCDLSLGFAGTATFTLAYSSWGWNQSAAGGTAQPVYLAQVSTASATQIISTSTATYLDLDLEGVVICTAGGTFRPELTYSATPGSTTIVKKHSYCELIPLGSDTFAQQGGWA